MYKDTQKNKQNQYDVAGYSSASLEVSTTLTTHCLIVSQIQETSAP